MLCGLWLKNPPLPPASSDDPAGARRRARADDDGHARRAVQTARVCVSVVGNLRRLERLFRLRAARLRTAPQHPQRVVGGHGAPARRHRGHRLLHHLAPESLGSLRPHPGLHRPDGGLQGVQATLPRRPVVLCAGRRRGRDHRLRLRARRRRNAGRGRRTRRTTSSASSPSRARSNPSCCATTPTRSPRNTPSSPPPPRASPARSRRRAISI